MAIFSSNSPTPSSDNSDSVENFVQGEIFADIFPNMPALTPKKSIKKEQEELLSRLPEFRVIRSSRRKRTLHAFRQNGVIEIHIPDRLSRRQEFEVIPEMIDLVLKRENRLRKSDSALFEMSDAILAEYLPEFSERPISITWRSMRERWGSCTTVDKTIRISDRLNGAPNYVLRYVLFHELIHLRIAGHDDDFHELLARYGDKERAEAFLEGYEAGSQGSPDEILELPPI
ncbi:MAG: SprT-like domain-containing protein [Actinomycetes bacterium]